MKQSPFKTEESYTVHSQCFPTIVREKITFISFIPPEEKMIVALEIPI